MGVLEKIMLEKLREKVVQAHYKGFTVALTQYKVSYKGVSMYWISAELECNGEYCDTLEYHETYNREVSDRYFSKLESRYPQRSILSKIF